ncbi:MAG TPA: hypothetical protein VNO14_18230 [Blastocatellia bacterium]|nr:hypothetical protein [Blastocatellia bacterium]
MHPESPSRRRAIAGAFLKSLLLAFFITTVAVAAGAQSGRRIPKKSEPPAPVQGAKDEEPPVKTEAKTEAPGLAIMVVRDTNSMRSPEYLADAAIDSISSRLKEARSLSVRRTRGMNRKEASDHAKQSKTEHVLWVELDFDTMMRSSVDRSRPEFHINYTLFAPETGKVAASGRVYERPYQPRVGGVGIPLPVPGARQHIEYLVRQAGEDLAERVMSELNVSAPRR